MATIKTKTAAALKDIPESFWIHRKLPETDTELEEFVPDVEADYEPCVAEISGNGKPKNQLTSTPPSTEQIDAILSRIKY
ncbi:MAG: hypothetical protein WKF89_01975 [Chitinophagaceae bacterium]